MPDYVHNSGAFKPAIGRWRRESGVWKPPTQLYTRQSSTWKPVLATGGGLPTLEKTTRGASASGADPTIPVVLGSTTSGRLLICGVANKEGSSTVYATGCKVSGGSAMTEETSARELITKGTSRYKVQLYWGVETSSTGSTDFEVTIANSDNVELVVFEVTGADNSSPFGAIITDSKSSSGVFEPTLNTTVANSLILCFMNGQDDDVTPATDIIEDVDYNYDSSHVVFAGHRDAEDVAGYTVGGTFGSGGSGNGGTLWAAEVLAA